jgi:hypothetical protein
MSVPEVGRYVAHGREKPGEDPCLTSVESAAPEESRSGATPMRILSNTLFLMKGRYTTSNMTFSRQVMPSAILRNSSRFRQQTTSQPPEKFRNFWNLNNGAIENSVQLMLRDASSGGVKRLCETVATTAWIYLPKTSSYPPGNWCCSGSLTALTRRPYTTH